MRYALIMAGGSGTRLWPMSRSALPKQLIPFIGGKSLLRLAFERLEGLVPVEQPLHLRRPATRRSCRRGRAGILARTGFWANRRGATR